VNELNDEVLLMIGLAGLIGGFLLLYLLFGRTYSCRRCDYPIPRSESRCPDCGWTSERAGH
jgi:hypothetical protein